MSIMKLDGHMNSLSIDENLENPSKNEQHPEQNGHVPHEDESALRLKEYTALKVIGRGAYAKVLLVEQKSTKERLAMKVIRKNVVRSSDWVQTELSVFETVSSHPFLVKLHTSFQTPSRLYFVMELISGGDLYCHMMRKKRIPEDHGRFYGAEICLALKFLHSKGILYRDLKLDNVLLAADGHIKLIDYGLCKEGIHKGGSTSTFCGSPIYVAPEILQAQAYSYPVDWWALGILMYEILSGRGPYDNHYKADNPDTHTETALYQVILENPIRIPRTLSVKAGNLIKGLLKKEPSQRLGSISGFSDIANHQFFASMEWDRLEKRQITPPYHPQNLDETDNFDPDVTQQSIAFTPESSENLADYNEDDFRGFEYIDPSILKIAS